MSRFSTRVSKLEQRFPSADDLQLVFVSFGGPSEPSDARWAIVPQVGGIWRHDGESQTEFKRRAYALKAAGKPLDDLSKAELAAAYSEVDRLIAESNT